MMSREQANKQQADNLLRLANDLFVIMHETNLNPYDMPEYRKLAKHKNKLNKANKRYPQYIGIDCSDYLKEFCIPFKYIPNEIMEFMISIEWVNHDTLIPYNKHGFYSSAYHSLNKEPEYLHCTVTEWFIDVSRYLELLLIYNRLKEQFSKKVA